MRHLQFLLVVLLTGIALELGLIAVKLPAPAAHAAPIQAPAPALEDAHDTLKRQIAELASDLLRLVESHNRYAGAANSVSSLYIKLDTHAEKVARLGEVTKARPDDRAAQAQLMGATRLLGEMQMSFNLQYLQLQNQMQNENRQFTMVSNIMKTKHDTVKNSISNIR